MTSPICTVQDGAGAPQATTNGANVTNGNTVTVALVSNAGVNTWTLQCIGTDDLNAAAAINAGITINALAKTATFPAPAIGSGLIFQSQVNGGLGSNFTIDKTLTTTFGIWTLTGGGYRVGVQNETFEGNATYGWLTKVNAFFRAGSSGVGTVAYTMDAGSSSVAAGQCLCLATGGTKVTSVMTSGALAAAGAVLGMALSSAAANGNCTLSVEGIVPNSITGLGAGTVSAVRVNTSTGYAQRVASFGVGDYPLGYCNASGDLTLVRGIVVGVGPTGTAGGALGSTYPNPTIALASNASITGILDATKVATGGAISGASMNAATIVLAANAGLTGKLDLAKQTAPTTTGVQSVVTTTTSGAYDAAAIPVSGFLREQTVATGTNVVPIDAGTAPTTAPGTTKANLYADVNGLHHVPANGQLLDEAIGAAVLGTVVTQVGKFRRFICFGSTSGAVTTDTALSTVTNHGCTVWIRWNARNTATGDCAGARGTFVFKNISGTVTQATADEKGTVLTTNAAITAQVQMTLSGATMIMRGNGVAGLTLDWTFYIEVLDN
jgi:hypothetical protein